jgi:2-succinyl-6-hydroxy-2,4-cyclohexadiene-1-carboxylate synthase
MTPLVLLHGFLGSSADFHPLMDGLLPEHPSVAVDLPGHGPEPEMLPDDATFEEVVEGLGEFIAQIETPQIDLLGYSMGGRLAMGLMLAEPERIRRVVLIGASAGIDDAKARAARAALDEERAHSLAHAALPAWLDAWYAQPLFASLRHAPGYEAMLARRCEGHPEALAQALRLLSSGRQPPLRQRLATCPVRALLMAGSLDERYAASNRALADANPLFESVTVPEAGHAPHLEQPDDVLFAVRSFLERD